MNIDSLAIHLIKTLQMCRVNLQNRQNYHATICTERNLTNII